MQHKTDYKIVFSDVDGTLLNSRHELSVHTKSAIESLQKKGIPFVIISARSPSGIYPIQKTYQFKSPIICYSGAMILDENRNVLYEKGFSRALAKEIAAYIEENRLACVWNVYAGDTWMVKDKKDPRVIREETIVQAEAVEGMVDSLPLPLLSFPVFVFFPARAFAWFARLAPASALPLKFVLAFAPRWS